MRTLLITFDGGDEFNQEKQIRRIAESCEGETDLLIVNDYDHLDRCIEEVKGLGYTNMIVLHENNLQYDDFEVALKSEYKRLVEHIEVLPEQFYRPKKKRIKKDIVFLDQNGKPMMNKASHTNNLQSDLMDDPNCAGIAFINGEHQKADADFAQYGTSWINGMIGDSGPLVADKNNNNTAELQKAYPTLKNSNLLNESIIREGIQIFRKKDYTIAQSQKELTGGDPNNVEPDMIPKSGKFCVLPWNGPVGGTVKASAIINQAAGILDAQGIKGITYCPQGVQAYWCSKCGDIAKRFKGIKKFNDFTVVNFSSCGPLFQSTLDYISKNPPPGTQSTGSIIIYADKSLHGRINNEIKQIQPQPQVTLEDINNLLTAGVVSVGDSTKAYAAGYAIGKDLQDKKIVLNKKNMKNCQEWLGNEGEIVSKNPRYAQRKFLIECITQIMMWDQFVKEAKEPTNSDKWKRFRDRTHQQFGFGESFKTAQQNVDNLGGGLFLDIIKTGVDAAKTAMEKEKNPTNKDEGKGNIEQIIVTHEKWDEFVKCFEDFNVYQALSDEKDANDTVQIGTLDDKGGGDKGSGESGSPPATGGSPGSAAGGAAGAGSGGGGSGSGSGAGGTA